MFTNDQIPPVPSEEKQGGEKKHKKPIIIAFAGGKGGTGQSFVAANMGVLLSRFGHSAILADAQRWGCNLHSLVGMERPALDIDSLEDGEAEKFEDIIFPTSFDRLKLMNGIKEAPSRHTITNQPYLIEELSKQDVEYCLVDLGSHLSFSLMDHFLNADIPLLVATPEPTSMERTYEFLKNLFFRLVKSSEMKLGLEGLVDKIMLEGRKLGVRTPHDLMEVVKFYETRDGEKLVAKIREFKLYIVLNQVKSKAEASWGNGVVSLCQRYFGLPVEYLGSIVFDSVVGNSVRRREALHVSHSNSDVAKDLERLVHRISSQKNISRKD